MQPRGKPWYKKWWAITLAVLASLILVFFIALVFYFFDLVKISSQELSNQNLNLNTSNKFTVQTDGNYWIGAAKPKITIIEFGDFNCPNCQNAYPKIREISLKYKNEVKFIFKDYPIYDFSLELAEAARCAGEQGFFWLMYDKLYQNQGLTNKTQVMGAAEQIGLDTAKFEKCYDDQKYLNDIKKDFLEAEKLGLSGTPTWFINGYKIEGDIPYNLFIQIIESLLKK